MSEPFSLSRFVDAQNGQYETALAELRRGHKRTHWMWFIFPQIAGLGSSAMAQRYAIVSLEEARAFLDHPLLSARYRECITALQDLAATSAEEVFGGIDALKLRSSLTLFGEVHGDALFVAALARWFDGEKDPATMRILEAER